MKKLSRLFMWQVVGVFVIFALATFWHNLYELIPSPIIGIIAPVNESPWEHVKLFFVPALIFYVIEYLFIGKHYENFITAHVIALVFMPIFMLLFYYAYEGLLNGGDSIILNILNTFLTIFLGQTIAYWLTRSDLNLQRYNKLSILIVILMFALYALWTFYPPKTPLFYDKTEDRYGINLWKIAWL